MNKVNKYMKAKEVLKVLGISRSTLYRYKRDGIILVKTKFNDNFHEYDDDSVYRLLGDSLKKHDKQIVSYARVSTQNQKKQLQEQNQQIYDSCISRGLKLDRQFSDIKSGMSVDRKEFQEMMNLIIQNKIEIVVIENKDRLVRFGYEILEHVCKCHGCQIIVLNDILENKTYEQELTEDLISVIHYFTMKSYSHRRKLNQLRKELENEQKSKTKLNNNEN